MQHLNNFKKTGNIFLFGDSYSTFENYIPKGNEAYYPNEDTKVTEYSKTWVSQFEEKTNGKIVINESFSGATICNTGYNGKDSFKSFVRRLQRYIDKGFFKENKIDTMIIMGGTNDSWANSPIGEIKYDEITKDDLYKVLPALCYLLKKIKNEIKIENILFILNSEQMKEELVSQFKVVLKKYDIPFLELKDIETVEGHPTDKGMKKIAEEILCVTDRGEKYEI